jgi:hypothetical protein
MVFVPVCRPHLLGMKVEETVVQRVGQSDAWFGVSAAYGK